MSELGSKAETQADCDTALSEADRALLASLDAFGVKLEERLARMEQGLIAKLGNLSERLSRDMLILRWMAALIWVMVVGLFVFEPLPKRSERGSIPKAANNSTQTTLPK